MNDQGKPDKYKAIWISYSGLNEFLRCPRAYYLQYVYKDPKTRRKLSIMAPQLALGQAVHNTIEPLANVPAPKRMQQPIHSYFDDQWSKVSGTQGGFSSDEQEMEMKERGCAMIERIIKEPGPLVNKATRIPEHANGMPPNFYLSEKDNVILCGNIDWLEYNDETGGIHIIDFKTGRNSERDDSLQLPIYLLLATYLQSRPVEKASYWYLDRPDGLEEKALPDASEAHERVMEKARRLVDARQSNTFTCPHGGRCFACDPFERILEGNATYIGVNDMNKDTYVLS